MYTMILADLHIHSTFSDGKMTISELVDFYGSRGFGCIAITDHLCESDTFLGKAARYLESTLTKESFPRYLETIAEEGERAKVQYGMIVIPGFELTKNTVLNHRSAHMLGLGVTEWIDADADVVDLAKAIKAQGAFAAAAHPVHTRRLEKQTYHLWDRRDELAPILDAWEVASGRYIFDEVMSSRLPMIATSDLHRPEQINAYKTLIDSEKHPEAILDALRKQKVSFRMYEEKIDQIPRDRSSIICIDEIARSSRSLDMLSASKV